MKRTIRMDCDRSKRWAHWPYKRAGIDRFGRIRSDFAAGQADRKHMDKRLERYQEALRVLREVAPYIPDMPTGTFTTSGGNQWYVWELKRRIRRVLGWGPPKPNQMATLV